MSDRRRAGVLLHPTSLPGPADGGLLGADARRFVDLLAAAGFRVWQMLPVGPVGESLSPYQSGSATAGNLRLVDPAALVEPGWLEPGEVAGAPAWPERQALLALAFRRFAGHRDRAPRAALAAYWQANRSWLLPYGLFLAARERHGDAGWWEWPAPLRDREPGALAELLASSQARLQETAFGQFLFDSQWRALRDYAGARGVTLFGDIPIYVDLDSADVWWHRKLFRLGPGGRPTAVAGVPPDYFSAEGQVWGNPLYDWPALQASGFRWWLDRIDVQLRRFDLLRLDHFRGLEAYWEVPAGARSARGGCWREAPGGALLSALEAHLGSLPIVAEDLGTITPAVTALRDRFGLPGMLILQFAFDGSPDNPYRPEHHRVRAVVYPGTHDNDTLAGWWQSLDAHTRSLVAQVTGVPPGQLPGGLLEVVLRSPAELAVLPFQDLLGLGSEARMNTPGTVTGNWSWRFRWEQVPADLAVRWGALLQAAGRAGPAAASSAA